MCRAYAATLSIALGICKCDTPSQNDSYGIEMIYGRVAHTLATFRYDKIIPKYQDCLVLKRSPDKR